MISTIAQRTNLLALNAAGIVTAAWLRSIWRYAIVAIAIIAALLPGVDPVTTSIEIAPLWVLFEASIQLSRIVERRRASATLTAPWHAQP